MGIISLKKFLENLGETVGEIFGKNIKLNKYL
jgi:hypothetical protein